MAKAGLGASDPDIICIVRKHRVGAGAGPEFRTFRFRECQHELSAALELQLVENVMKVHFNGAFAYVHLARDLFVAQATNYAFDDLPFPRGDGILSCPLRREDKGQNVRIHPASSARDTFNALEELAHLSIGNDDAVDVELGNLPSVRRTLEQEHHLCSFAKALQTRDGLDKRACRAGTLR